MFIFALLEAGGFGLVGWLQHAYKNTGSFTGLQISFLRLHIFDVFEAGQDP
jgi:hypothetical protein